MVSVTTALPFGRAITRDDLDAMPDDGHRYELVDGTLLVSPAPSRRHQDAVLNLARVLQDACPPELRCYVAPFDVVLPNGAMFQPDVLVANRADLTERDLPAAPVLAVEVLSPARAASTCSSSTTGTPTPVSRTTGSSTRTNPASRCGGSDWTASTSRSPASAATNRTTPPRRSLSASPRARSPPTPDQRRGVLVAQRHEDKLAARGSPARAVPGHSAACLRSRGRRRRKQLGSRSHLTNGLAVARRLRSRRRSDPRTASTRDSSRKDGSAVRPADVSASSIPDLSDVAVDPNEMRTGHLAFCADPV